MKHPKGAKHTKYKKKKPHLMWLFVDINIIFGKLIASLQTPLCLYKIWHSQQDLNPHLVLRWIWSRNPLLFQLSYGSIFVLYTMIFNQSRNKFPFYPNTYNLCDRSIPYNTSNIAIQNLVKYYFQTLFHFISFFNCNLIIFHPIQV